MPAPVARKVNTFPLTLEGKVPVSVFDTSASDAVAPVVPTPVLPHVLQTAVTVRPVLMTPATESIVMSVELPTTTGIADSPVADGEVVRVCTVPTANEKAAGVPETMTLTLFVSVHVHDTCIIVSTVGSAGTVMLKHALAVVELPWKYAELDDDEVEDASSPLTAPTKVGWPTVASVHASDTVSE